MHLEEFAMSTIDQVASPAHSELAPACEDSHELLGRPAQRAGREELPT
jgi:hypothetical protein